MADADEVARTAERNEAQVARLLATATTARSSPVQDWPDLLARALRDDPGLPLGTWAAARGLHRGSLSRGFRQVFGCTPARFRVVARAHLAVRALQQTPAGLGDIASACGFADQAHMSRTVRALCGTSPARLRAAA